MEQGLGAHSNLVRLLELFFLPPALIALGMLACLILLAVRKRDKVSLAGVAIVFGLYYLFSTGPLTNVLVSGLEGQFPASSNKHELVAARAIVILAGSATPGDEGKRPGELNRASWRRLWRGIELYHLSGATIPILFSGGSGDEFDTTSSAAILAQQFARYLGIREEHFWAENESANTYESGIEIKKMLDKEFSTKVRHRVVLVTSAWHMPRAVGVFNRLGIEVIPEPCDYLSESTALSIRGLMPSYEALSVFSVAVREWIGIAVYQFQGRI